MFKHSQHSFNDNDRTNFEKLEKLCVYTRKLGRQFRDSTRRQNNARHGILRWYRCCQYYLFSFGA